MANSTTNPAGAPASAADLSTGHWVLDAAGSSVGFRHKSIWGLVTITGTFATVSGEGELGADGRAHGTLVVDAASVDTKKKKLNTHLRSADFFQVDKHPDFTFTADSVVADSSGNAQVTGRLTVLGTSRPLTFSTQVTAAGPADVTLIGEVAVDRNDFGMAWKNPGGAMRGLTIVTLKARFTLA